MKKYTFTLQKLLQFKQQILKKEKNTLSIINSEFYQKQKNITNVFNKRVSITSELEIRKSQIISAELIKTYKSYISCLDSELIKLKNEAETIKKRVDNQLKIVIELTKEINALEKLEEKQYAEYRKQEEKEQEYFIEEFVSKQKVQMVSV